MTPRLFWIYVTNALYIPHCIGGTAVLVAAPLRVAELVCDTSLFAGDIAIGGGLLYTTSLGLAFATDYLARWCSPS